MPKIMKRHTALALVIAGTLILTCTFYLKSELVWGDELLIAYTANSSGKLKFCGCPNDQFGGLSERVTLIKRLRQMENPFLLVDGGNMLGLWGSYDEKAACVMKIMNLMKYDAAGIGFYELYHGADSTIKMGTEAQFPLLSVTIIRNSDGAHIAKPYVIVRAGDSNVGIISVCDSTSIANIGSSVIKDFSFLPLPEMLLRALDEITSKTDYIVVLSQLPAEENTKLLESFQGIDLIIQAYGNKKNDPPIVTSHGIIAAPGSKGQFIGMVTLDKSKTGKISIKHHEFIPVINFPQDEEARELIKGYYNRNK